MLYALNYFHLNMLGGHPIFFEYIQQFGLTQESNALLLSV